MSFEIPVVIDRATLDSLVSPDDAARALVDWLTEHNTKAIVLQSDWKDFSAHWEHHYTLLRMNLQCARRPYLSHRGVVRQMPFRSRGVQLTAAFLSGS